MMMSFIVLSETNSTLAAACPLALRVWCSHRLSPAPPALTGSHRLSPTDSRKDCDAVDSQRSHECPGAAGRPPQRLRVARPLRPHRHARHLDSVHHVPAPMRAHDVGQVRPRSSALGGRRRRERGDAPCKRGHARGRSARGRCCDVVCRVILIK
jgi:hypothetical protein